MTLKENCLYRTSKNKIKKQDYLFVFLASLICACGFALNSETVIIGSMLISPLLKPIINLAISILKRKQKVIGISLIHILGMFVTSIITGCIIGLIFYEIFPNLRNTFKNAMQDEQNEQNATTILGRVAHVLKWPPVNNFWYIILIAIAGGILLARTNCTEYSDLTTAIIGTGIATSILPPIIAGSMMLTVNSEHSWKKFGNGLLLSLINILFIFISYMATLFFSS